MKGNRHTIAEIAAMMENLGVWEIMRKSNWTLRPRGVAVPYFCILVNGAKGDIVVRRLLLLEGWQTMHDYVRMTMDRNFGYYISPYEMPHYELAFLRDGKTQLYRHDPGYLAVPIKDEEITDTIYGMLWEVYGVMMRLEEDSGLAIKYASEKAMFSMVEGADGKWREESFPIIDPKPYVEKVSFPKAELSKAKDLPMEKELVIEFDFRVIEGVLTKERKPRMIYELRGVDAKTGKVEFAGRMSVSQDFGLKDMWQSMPILMLKLMISRGRVPGEIKVQSARVFRLLRGMCIEIPFKISMNDALPALERSFGGRS